MVVNLIALPEQKTKVEIAKSRMHALEHLGSYVMDCVRSEIVWLTRENNDHQFILQRAFYELIMSYNIKSK